MIRLIISCFGFDDGCISEGERKREFQSTLDGFFTSPLAKRQRPATEEEETYLE